MATKKDLVEAYSFSRRRLVTAFVSGAPGGREVEPARPGRTIVGGLAIGVLLLAGAAILGVFKPHASVEWDKPMLLSDSHGGLYVNLGGSGDETTLHPVINATSAQLILGAAVEPQKIPDSVLNPHGRGGPLGILNAPATVPDTSQLIQSGWSACTATHHGLRVAVLSSSSTAPATTPYAGAFLVRDADGYHVIATNEQGRAYAYAVDNPSGELSSGLHLPDAVAVSARWTALFPRGEQLDSSGLHVERFGQPAHEPSAPSGARYGDYFLSNGVVEVLVPGGFSPASPFATLVLDANNAREVAAPTGEWHSSGSVGSDTWPTQLPPGSAVPPSQLCAVLHDNGDGTTSVRTAVEPQGEASAVAVAAGAIDPFVSPGFGAVVRSASKDPATDPSASATPIDTSGTTYLVDDRAYRYRIATPADAANLGYADLPPVVVPPQWIGLFRSGVELSRDAALCPPVADEGAKACS